jgi:hypothetical protein
MSRMPAVAEFEAVTKVQPVEATHPSLISMVAAALGRVLHELALMSARRRLYRYATADHRFLGDIGAARGGEDQLVRNGRRHVARGRNQA